VLLDHRAHRAVNDGNAFAQDALEMFDSAQHLISCKLINIAVQSK
jgi:hypothetical protein